MLRAESIVGLVMELMYWLEHARGGTVSLDGKEFNLMFFSTEEQINQSIFNQSI